MILGVDPGISGALAFFDPSIGALEVLDMPTRVVKINRKERKRLDVEALAAVLEARAHKVTRAIVEAVSGVKGQAAGGSFEFGKATGIAIGAIAAHLIPIVYRAPVVWKRSMGVTADKSSSRKKASELAPLHAHNWQLVKHDGRAEAFLLAYYLATFG